MNFYNHEFTLLNNERVHLSKYSDKVILVVNTASHCGLTPQYEALEELYNTYKDKGFVVLGFPSGDFANQEFDSNNKIQDFCESEYGISFPVFEKSHVVPNSCSAPGVFNSESVNEVNSFYKLLGETTRDVPRWNFHKYLVSKSATEVLTFNFDVTPLSKKIVLEIERMLK